MKRTIAVCVLSLVFASLCQLAGCNGNRPDESSDRQGARADATENIEDSAPEEVTVEQSTDLPPDWGSLQGRITLSGAPQPEKIEVTQDGDYCGKFDLVDESIKVNEMGGGLANVVVWLYTERDEEPPAPHESYAETNAAELVFDNVQCRFTPRIVTIRPSQTLVIKNSDPKAHTAQIEYEPAPVNFNLAAGATQRKQFPEPARFPVPVSCTIHPWMRAKIVVKDTPYMAVTDENGEFEIDLLPPGDWKFQFWHEQFGYLQQVEFLGKPTRWDRGLAEFPIAGGKLTDVGNVNLKYEDYAD